MGEALPNQEIFRRLALAMGFTEPALTEPDAPILDRAARACGVAGGFAELQAKATVDVWNEPVAQFADGKFPTPSGKIEIASEAAAADGHPAAPQATVDARPAPGLYRLLSPANLWLMNSSYGNDPAIQAKLGPERIAIHPQDAAKLGLQSGDRVRLENETGRLEMDVEVAALVPPGVLLGSKSRWPKALAGHANINALNPGHKSDMGESSAVHGVEVRLVPLGRGVASPAKAAVPAK
jgi:anaerobic selenocysteine-containing dehydrogenase